MGTTAADVTVATEEDENYTPSDGGVRRRALKASGRKVIHTHAQYSVGSAQPSDDREAASGSLSVSESAKGSVAVDVAIPENEISAASDDAKVVAAIDLDLDVKHDTPIFGGGRRFLATLASKSIAINTIVDGFERDLKNVDGTKLEASVASDTTVTVSVPINENSESAQLDVAFEEDDDFSGVSKRRWSQAWKEE